jgi:D-glycero-D-manno-heptose 1,7-bisphosphate phosphatase
MTRTHRTLLSPSSTCRAVFLDRDGTLTRDSGYSFRVEELELLENVVPGLRLISMLNYRLIVVTNQSGIARGRFSEEQMHAFNDAMSERLESQGVRLDAIYHCPFHPDARVPQYRQESRLRKPLPGMLEQAAADFGLQLSECFIIGDKKSDALAGKAASCRSILVQTGAAGGGEFDLLAQPDWIAVDLLQCAQIIAREHVAIDSRRSA